MLFKILYVYILKCKDGTYYTGVTNNLQKRFEEHLQGKNTNSYTYNRRPLELVYSEKFRDYNLAILWEKRVKKWSKKKKEALIQDNWDILKIESACKNETSHKLYSSSRLRSN